MGCAMSHQCFSKESQTDFYSKRNSLRDRSLISSTPDTSDEHFSQDQKKNT